jgi:hypothetical protein
MNDEGRDWKRDEAYMLAGPDASGVLLTLTLLMLAGLGLVAWIVW